MGTVIDLEAIKESSELNAKKHLEVAEFLREKDISFAYVHLVFCLEELAKAKMCIIYDIAMNSCSDIKFESKTFDDMFRSHPRKHLTMLIQFMFDVMVTTPELTERVEKALRKGNCDEIPELINPIKMLTKAHNKRKEIMYVEKDAEIKTITKEEFEELHKFVLLAFERTGQAGLFIKIPYEEIERNVEKIKKQLG